MTRFATPPVSASFAVRRRAWQIPTTQGVTLRGVSGSGASRTLVVADGWALNDPFGSWVYWNRIPLAAVDRVEVVRGATGDLYGSDALGGVIQVLTLDTDRPRLRGLFEAGSHDTYPRLRLWRPTVSATGRSPAGAEWQNTDGAYVVAEEDRGAVDVPAFSDYQSGFGTAGYGSGDVARDASRQPRQRGPRQRHAGAGQQHRVAAVRW